MVNDVCSEKSNGLSFLRTEILLNLHQKSYVWPHCSSHIIIYDMHQSVPFPFDVSYSHVLTGLPGNT